MGKIINLFRNKSGPATDSKPGGKLTPEQAMDAIYKANFKSYWQDLTRDNPGKAAAIAASSVTACNIGLGAIIALRVSKDQESAKLLGELFYNMTLENKDTHQLAHIPNRCKGYVVGDPGSLLDTARASVFLGVLK